MAYGKGNGDGESSGKAGKIVLFRSRREDRERACSSLLPLPFLSFGLKKEEGKKRAFHNGPLAKRLVPLALDTQTEILDQELAKNG